MYPIYLKRKIRYAGFANFKTNNGDYLSHTVDGCQGTDFKTTTERRAATSSSKHEQTNRVSVLRAECFLLPSPDSVYCLVTWEQPYPVVPYRSLEGCTRTHPISIIPNQNHPHPIPPIMQETTPPSPPPVTPTIPKDMTHPQSETAICILRVPSIRAGRLPSVGLGLVYPGCDVGCC